jgi:ABC-type Fe3+-hydroxamate transport system substrate-binding protein
VSPASLDAAGAAHPPARGEVRIVSLVPSITELLCDLGLAGQLVGRTGFCIHPWETVRAIPKVGGTKDVRLQRIRELRPTHVVVNVDENTRETADALRGFTEVIVTHPLTPADNPPLYRLLGEIFDRADQARALCDAFALSDLARSSSTDRARHLHRANARAHQLAHAAAREHRALPRGRSACLLR